MQFKEIISCVLFIVELSTKIWNICAMCLYTQCYNWVSFFK